MSDTSANCHRVYLLAHSRREAFYIAVASGTAEYKAAWQGVNAMMSRVPECYRRRPKMVWMEDHATRDEADRRCTEIRALPHAWQRRLVEQKNPAWDDLEALETGFPRHLARPVQN
jgi:predicted GIY-YIG superfamily endonuclease